MSTRPGIVWGGNATPSDLVVRMSAYGEQFSEENISRIVGNMLEDAVEQVRHLIETRGVKDGIPNSEGRVKTEKMLKSVGWRGHVTGTGRVVGEFGYLYQAPKWALWQEYGTYGGQGNGQGILAMLALTDAYRDFKNAMEDLFAQGGFSNRREGNYNFGSSGPVRGY